MITGRKKEQKILEAAYESRESEFIVIYGRRRVGKTYLIREFFMEKECLFFHTTGIYKGALKTQLSKFIEELSKLFFDNVPLETPSSWDAAFKLLNQQIMKDRNKKIVIFLDELPWLASRKSGAIDYYWNQHWSHSKKVVFIACGSSASWLIKNIIYNKGGLHNRVTKEIRLLPFNLLETKDYLRYRKIKLNNRHILSIYMALGGIPYYLKYIESGLTAEQNIQNIIFDKNAPLKDEFTKLFHSLFRNSDAYVEIIQLLSTTKSGVTRSDINRFAKLSTNGGSLSERLKDLCNTGFIEEHISWKRKKGEYYKLTDEFCLFFLKWIGHKTRHHFVKDYWIAQSSSQSYKTWAGFAFENVCVKHVDNIISALNIKSAKTVASWRYIPRKQMDNGAQIDLLIDRIDDAVTICEIKYTNNPFVIDKKYAENLENKLQVFKSATKTQKQLFIAFISANGIKNNVYSKNLVSGTVGLNDLFN